MAQKLEISRSVPGDATSGSHERTTGGTISRCPACGGADLRTVLHVDRVPVFCNVLADTVDDALAAPRGDIELALCTDCGLLSNVRFDERLVAYAPGYENSLHHSPTFQAYAERLARRLVQERGLVGGTVLEIGPGQGEFLRLLCDAGCDRGLGYDPSHAGDAPTDDRVRITRDPFPSDGTEPVDLVVCRHVLEHVADPQKLLAGIDGQAGVVFYLEVPDADHMLRSAAVWDVIYEHCTYYSSAPLAWLLGRRGFRIDEIGTSFGGQFLWVMGRTPDHPGMRPVAYPDVTGISVMASRFGDVFRARVSGWNERIADLAERSPVAVWGTGSKGTTFLNLVPATGSVRHVVDINPIKHGRFVPGTGHRVVPPDALRDDPPGTVIVMNPIYADEVRSTLAALGLDPHVVTA